MENRIVREVFMRLPPRKMYCKLAQCPTNFSLSWLHHRSAWKKLEALLIQPRQTEVCRTPSAAQYAHWSLRDLRRSRRAESLKPIHPEPCPAIAQPVFRRLAKTSAPSGRPADRPSLPCPSRRRTLTLL